MDSDTMTKRSLKSFSYQNVSNLILDYTQRIIKYMYVGDILVQFSLDHIRYYLLKNRDSIFTTNLK